MVFWANIIPSEEMAEIVHSTYYKKTLYLHGLLHEVKCFPDTIPWLKTIYYSYDKRERLLLLYNTLIVSPDKLT